MYEENFSRFLVALLLFSQQSVAQDDYWPKEIPLKTGGKILIYQPQPDELNGNILKGRTAVGGKEKANDPMVYGAIFFDATISTDKDSRMATLESVKISNAKMDGVDDKEKLQKMIALIENEVPKWNFDFSLDQLKATIKRRSGDGEMFNNTPPKIFYRDKPTSLVILDGEPKIKKDKDLDADRVLNSPNLIFREGNQWNMYEGGIWYMSSQVTSGWVAAKSMSAKVKSINEQIKKQEKEANGGKAPTEKPIVTDIIVSTEPAEIIQTKGTPQYKTIEGTTLQYVSNTKNDILKTKDGTIFILIAGRWYKSSSLNGPWTFNGSDKMPLEFAKIPEGSEKDNVLVSISGTPAAEEAIIDAEIPQTAKVDRKTAKVDVAYDGNPQFETIAGTSLQLAENANLTVLKEASGNFFALDNGVWFISKSAKGPWSVADKRPEGLEAIPPSSPAFNARYVYIYEVAKDYVVTGYTSGYLGTYVQGDPVVVFGTGYYYRPWYGTVYYPRPTTWGFCFSYNPWTGWTMGYSYNVGFLHIGFSTGPAYGYGGGWFGPPYYRPPYRPPYYGGGYYGRPGGGNTIIINGDVNIGGNHNNIYNRPGNNGGGNRPGISSRPGNNNNRPGSSYRPGNNNTNSGSRPGNNNNNNTGSRPGNSNNNWNNKPSARPSTNNKNNVFTDQNGNVFQKDDKGNINQRDNKSNSWKPADKSSTGASQVTREAQARDRSNQQRANYNRVTRPSTTPANRPPGGASTRPAPAGKPASQPSYRPPSTPAARPAARPATRPAGRG